MRGGPPTGLPTAATVTLVSLLRGGARAQPAYQTTVRGAAAEKELPEERATSQVSQGDIARRQATTAAEALSWEPGVSAVQASHGQGLAYIRGLTRWACTVYQALTVYRWQPDGYLLVLAAHGTAPVAPEPFPESKIIPADLFDEEPDAPGG